MKALAILYYDSRRDKLGPLSSAISTAVGGKDDLETGEVAERRFLTAANEAEPQEPKLAPEELEVRLKKIDWLRFRKHWIDITGRKLDKDGKPQEAPDQARRRMDH